MSKLPVISARECVKALEKVGLSISRQTGSHIMTHLLKSLYQIINPLKKGRYEPSFAKQV